MELHLYLVFAVKAAAAVLLRDAKRSPGAEGCETIKLLTRRLICLSLLS